MTEMESEGSWKGSTFAAGWMDTESEKCQECGGRGDAVK